MMPTHCVIDRSANSSPNLSKRSELLETSANKTTNFCCISDK